MISDEIKEMSVVSSEEEELENELISTTFSSSIGTKSLQEYEENFERNFNDKLVDSKHAVRLGLPSKPKPSNTVVVGHLDCSLDYEDLFWLLPVAIDEDELP